MKSEDKLKAVTVALILLAWLGLVIAGYVEATGLVETFGMILAGMGVYHSALKDPNSTREKETP